jgi:Rrf2 family cysteine metabolism transcriptional repressor
MPNNIKLSKKIHVAVRWLSYLAKNKNLNPKSSGEFAINENLSFYFLEEINSQLKKHDLITAKRGNWGGYLLAKPANKITLKKIIEAVEGPISLINCAKYQCSNTQCGQKNIWMKINKEIEKIFGHTKLSDLL